MPPLHFVHQRDRAARTAREMMIDNDRLATISAEELDVEVWAVHPGGVQDPQLLEVRYPPNVSSRAHAHEVDEIVVVIQGEMSFGNHVCAVGSSIKIPALTLYSFTAGAEGVTFLNFRACADASVLTANDLRARRQDRPSRGKGSRH